MVEASILIGLVGLVGTLIGQTMIRVSRLERKVDEANSRSFRLWHYCRALLDLYYKHRKETAPDPPQMPDVWDDEGDK